MVSHLEEVELHKLRTRVAQLLAEDSLSHSAWLAAVGTELAAELGGSVALTDDTP